MDYDNFVERIKPLFHFDTYVKPKADTKSVVRISVKKGEMTTYGITKSKFSQLNDKRFYFPNAIISLLFGHQALEKIEQYKKNQGQRIEKYFLQEKEHLIELEKAALKKCPRLDFLDNILLQHFKVLNNDNVNKYLYNDQEQSVLDYTLNAGRKTNIHSMENSKQIFS